MNPTHAIILAAGMGNRLKPLTDNIPKCLLPVAGKNFLERALNSLTSLKMQKIMVVTGYRENQIRDFVRKNFVHLNISFISNPDFKTTNTGYSAWLALKESEDPAYLIDGDLVFSPLLLRNLAEDVHRDALVVDSRIEQLNEEAMKAKINDRNQVLHLNKNLKIGEASGEFIGLSKLSSEFRRELCKKMEILWEEGFRANAYYEDAMNGLLQTGTPVHALITDGHAWCEVDTLEDWERANEMKID